MAKQLVLDSRFWGEGGGGGGGRVWLSNGKFNRNESWSRNR